MMLHMNTFTTTWIEFLILCYMKYKCFSTWVQTIINLIIISLKRTIYLLKVQFAIGFRSYDLMTNKLSGSLNNSNILETIFLY